MLVRRIAWAVLGLGVWAVVQGAAWGVTRTVPGQYKTIQAAVNACRAGDIVLVSPGKYAGFRFRAKAITVRSINPANDANVAATVIDGDMDDGFSLNLAVLCEAGTGRATVLDGLTFRNGETAVECRGNSTVRRCVFDQTDSSAIDVTGTAAPLINSCHFGKSSLDPSIICFDQSAPVIRSNQFTGTHAGSISAQPESRPVIEDNLIEGNALGRQAAVNVYGGSILRNVLRHNDMYNGAIRCSGDTRVIGNLIVRNSAETVGGGITCFGRPLIVGNTICDNSSGPSRGGNIAVLGGCPVIKNNIIAFAGRGGGIVNLGSGRPIVTYCDVYGNAGADLTGGMFLGAGMLNVEPRLHRPLDDTATYRLRSTLGRWTGKRWVVDVADSPCLDKADPASPFDLEPLPNGGRANLGYEGGTIYASKSRVHAPGAPLLLSAAAAPAGRGLQITTALSAPATVTAEVRNLAGRSVALLPPRLLSAGSGTLVWSGLCAGGSPAPSGSYFVHLTARTAGGESATALAAARVR